MHGVDGSLEDGLVAAAGPLLSTAPFSLIRALQLKTPGLDLAPEESTAAMASGTSLRNWVSDVWEVEWRRIVRQRGSVAACR